MAILKFKMADVKRVIDHAKANGGEVGFAHDHGVYLLSMAKPRDLVSGDEKDGRSFCAYAEGCHPENDEDWYDTAHDLVGGDDFGENLPVEFFKYAMEDGGEVLKMKVGARTLEAVAKPRYPLDQTIKDIAPHLIAGKRYITHKGKLKIVPGDKAPEYAKHREFKLLPALPVEAMARHIIENVWKGVAV